MMVNDGLVDEVVRLKRMGYGRELLSMQGIGYKEIYAFLEGEVSLEGAIDLIKKNTRHFAKRQLTWFRKEKKVTFVDYRDFADDKTKMLEFMINEINGSAERK